MTKRIAFFDSHIVDYRTLITQLQPGTEIVVLDEKRDGIEQILIALQAKSNLAAIDIISHGSPGSITLGSGVLNISNLNSYESQLLQIGRHLAEDGDILLYGCKVAQGEIGLDFIEQLSELTGSDVAASTSLTGATEMGGNWLLEAQIGSIQVQSMRFDYESVLADDFPNTTATTGSITIGGSSSGIIEEANDHDWFQVSLETGQIYEFRTDVGTNLAVYDADSILLSDLGTFDNGEISLVYTATKTGTHYLEAAIGPRFIDPFSYIISATQSVVNDEGADGSGGSSLPDDYPNTINTTGSVQIGGSTSGNIETISDRDWFQVTLISGRNYEFQLNSGSIDSFLTLYDPNGNSIIEDDDGGGGLNSLITYAAVSTGTHYIEAKSLNETGGYTVFALENENNIDDDGIASQDDYSDTIATTGFLTIGGNTIGVIEESFDRDWFQISLTAGDTYKAQVTSEDITPFIALYDASGILLDANYTRTQFGGDLDFTATETGTYYLGVYDVDHGRTIRIISQDDSFEGWSDSNTGNYTISVLDESGSLLPVDRIFNWAESVFPDLLPHHQESTEILGYYARIYDSGNAVGELDDNLYFYNGDSITLVGAVDDYLSNAIDAGF